MKAVAITAISSGQGKTLFTMAILHWLKNNVGLVRPFKVGPDYIDTRFHEKITGIPSVNLDLYMKSEEDVKKSFYHYANDAKCNVIEGVMGFYDGMDYGASTYDVVKTIEVPTVLIISAEGSYSTVAPMLKGILEYRKDNQVKGIILNKVSSDSHYSLVEKQLKKDLPDIELLGWIQKGLTAISSRHLGLDLTELDNKKLDEISESVMKNIDTDKFLNLMEFSPKFNYKGDLFEQFASRYEEVFKDLTLTIVYDDAFSFTYQQNIDFFHRFFKKVYKISGIANDKIPVVSDVVYIPGGYVETPEVSPLLDKAVDFKQSLKEFANTPGKRIYAECAGLMFLGEKIQTTDGGSINGAGLLAVDFEMQKKRNRLGYYKALDKESLNIYKGFSFHYSKPYSDKERSILEWGLFKDRDNRAEGGAWTNKNGNVLGTYLHSFFFNQPELVFKYMNPIVKPHS